MLASEMLESVNSSKPAVTVLIVAEGRKPVGIVTSHDVLLRGGERGLVRESRSHCSRKPSTAFSSSGSVQPVRQIRHRAIEAAQQDDLEDLRLVVMRRQRLEFGVDQAWRG